MRCFATVLLIILMAPMASAVETILTNGVRVSDQFWADLTPPEFDADPAKMTDQEFSDWANKHNEKQLADARQRHQEYLDARGPLKTVRRYTSSFDKNIRVGGGYGLGGFGGAGGYLGNDQFIDGLSGGNTFSGPHAGSSIGNNVTITGGSSGAAWTDTYPDLNDMGGGPVTFINPYCREYWAKHAKVAKSESPVEKPTAKPDQYPFLRQGQCTPP